MKLGNIMVVVFLSFLAWIGITIAGWGAAFAFASEMLAPWLGTLPPDYAAVAHTGGSILLAGTGSLVVLALVLALGLGGLALSKSLFGGRRRRQSQS